MLVHTQSTKRGGALDTQSTKRTVFTRFSYLVEYQPGKTIKRLQRCEWKGGREGGREGGK